MRARRKPTRQSTNAPTSSRRTAVCTLGGLVIGVWTWLSRDRVHPLEHVMGEFRRTGSYRTQGVVRPAVSFLLPLVFGGSVGFEAGLAGIVTSGCCWMRDKLKAAGLRVGEVANTTMAASITANFGTPLAGIVAGAQSTPADTGDDAAEAPARSVDAYNMRRNVKLVLYMAAAFGALGGTTVFSALFGQAGGLPRFDAVGAQGPELAWALPCIAVAYGMALVYNGSARLFANVARRMGEGALATVVKPVIAGAVLGTVAIALPFVLFSGETQAEELVAGWTGWGAAALIATGVLKAAVTPMCLHMGWAGGNFFPSIFAGEAVGYGIAALNGADPMLMVTVTTAAFLAAVVRKPVLVLTVLFLCFPVRGMLWMGLAVLVGAALPLPRALSVHGDEH